MVKITQYLAFLSLLFVITGCSLHKKNTSPEIAERKTIDRDSVEQLWYKGSVIYNLDIEVFKDSDDDGIGDIKGLISKLDYIKSLGVDAIWLSPFQPTPNKDDGYDVSDYYQIDKHLGTMDDFQLLIKKAHEKDIKILMDIVVNHTSNKHEWFEEAREDTNSKYHDWYLWSKEQPANHDEGMVFPGVQKETWTYDSLAGKYYYHRFYKFQPDLNMQNEEVKQEVKNIIAFWLNKNIDGFRLDAVPFIIEVPEKRGSNFEYEFEFLTEIRSLVDSINPRAMILGEANVLPEENNNYFGKEEPRIHMMLNFYVNQHLFYALASGDAQPLNEALIMSKDIPREAEWGQFLRNHDEVDLGRLTNTQRNKVYEAFGPEDYMQLYDRGIRRRLPTMMNGDDGHIRLAYNILFSLPSTPVIRYGDEIGMGDDLSLKERMSVRTPMQWDDTPGAGFTESENPVQPIIDSSVYNYQIVNVRDEQDDSTSLLNWTRRMVQLRKSHPEINYGSWTSLKTNSDNIVCLYYSWFDKNLLVVHNLAKKYVKVTIQSDSLTGKQFIAQKKDTIYTPVENELNLALKRYESLWLEVKP